MLDEQGWVAVAELIDKARRHGETLDRALREDIVTTNNKKRFMLSPDGQFIRAAQGHSVAVELGLRPVTPSDVLFHGTATRFLRAILAEGLKPGQREKVHLSGDEATAVKVGMRHGKPVVLQVAADAMARDGLPF